MGGVGRHQELTPLDRVVLGGVEETLNALPEAEADRACNAPYERIEARQNTRAVPLRTQASDQAGEVRLKVAKLRAQAFENCDHQRYWRAGSSVEEALIETYLAGVSVRRTPHASQPRQVTELLIDHISTSRSQGFARIPTRWPIGLLYGDFLSSYVIHL